MNGRAKPAKVTATRKQKVESRKLKCGAKPPEAREKATNDK
jgi:hypothetical protein